MIRLKVNKEMLAALLLYSFRLCFFEILFTFGTFLVFRLQTATLAVDSLLKLGGNGHAQFQGVEGRRSY